MITRPADTFALFSLAAAILERYTSEQIAGADNQLMADFLTVMRVHPAPHAVAKEVTNVMFMRYPEISHATQQKVIDLAAECENDSRLSDRALFQPGPYLTFSIPEELWTREYARLLLTLSPSLNGQFVIDQLASMIYCCPETVSMAFTVAKQVYSHLPPVIRFSQESIRSLTRLECAAPSTNVQFGFASQVIDEINRVHGLINLVNEQNDVSDTTC